TLASVASASVGRQLLSGLAAGAASGGFSGFITGGPMGALRGAIHGGLTGLGTAGGRGGISPAARAPGARAPAPAEQPHPGASTRETPPPASPAPESPAPARVPIPGDHDFIGPIAPGGRRLTPRGMGHHMVERVNVESRPTLAAFDRPDTPRYYPTGSPEAAGAAHTRLHAAIRDAGLAPQGGHRGVGETVLFQRYTQAYSDPRIQGIRGDVRTPNGRTVIATDVTPAQAYQALLQWFARQSGSGS